MNDKHLSEKQKEDAWVKILEQAEKQKRQKKNIRWLPVVGTAAVMCIVSAAVWFGTLSGSQPNEQTPRQTGKIETENRPQIPFMNELEKQYISDDEIVIEKNGHTLWLANNQAEMEIVYTPFNKETDWDPAYWSDSFEQIYLAKGEAGYYVQNSGFVYFCSLTENQMVPLCNRPDCLHDKETDEQRKLECNAFVRAPKRYPSGGTYVSNYFPIQYYGGKLYTRTTSWDDQDEDTKIIELFPDGSGRREVVTLEGQAMMPFYFHRGSLYYITTERNIGKMKSGSSIYRADENGKNPEKLVEFTSEAASIDFLPCGEYIYMYIRVGNGKQDRYVIIYDIETGNIKALYSDEEYVINGLATDGETLFAMKQEVTFEEPSDWQVTEGTLYRVDAGSNTMEELQTVDLSQAWIMEDGENYPMMLVRLGCDADYMYVFATSFDYGSIILVCDQETGEILRKWHIDNSLINNCMFLGTDKENIIFTDSFGKEAIVYWLEKEKMMEPGYEMHILQRE